MQGSNDLYWRVALPAKAVGAQVCRIPVATGKKILSEPNLDSPFRWIQKADGLTHYPDHTGTGVFTRPDMVRAIHAHAIKQDHGCRIVAEVDDNYLANPDLNINMRYLWRGREREAHMKAFAAFDAIITSTEWLRDEYARTFKRELGTRPEFHVCGNHADPDDWPARNPAPDGRLRVGWMGSPSHLWDVHLMLPALEWAKTAGHRVILIGHDPVTDPHTPRKWVLRWHRLNPEIVPWTDDYKRAGLPLDIALAPLRRDRHTLGKSDIKAVEYVMAGAAPILQNLEVYNQTWAHGETALLASSPAEFEQATRRLCEDDSLRARLVGAGEQYVREHRLIGQHVNEWKAAIGA